MADPPRRRRRIRFREPEAEPPPHGDLTDPGDGTAGRLRPGEAARRGTAGRPGAGERGAGERAGERGAEAAPPRVPGWGFPVATEGDRDENDRGLRSLVGNGSSQVGRSAAMRARDAARPTDADIAAAETQLVIVRRGWVPRD